MKWVLYGLICGMIGDICLTKGSVFVVGVCAFLLGHIFYVLAFTTLPWILANNYVFSFLAFIATLGFVFFESTLKFMFTKRIIWAWMMIQNKTPLLYILLGELYTATIAF